MGERSRTLDRFALSKADKFVDFTETGTLDVNEQLVRCTNAAAATLTLPDVAEAAGRMYAIYYPVDTGGDVTITQTGAEGWDGDYTLDTVGDGYLLYSDGRHWWPIGALA